MDHIPLPAEHCLPHPEIEYICSNTFSLTQDYSFETYPAHYGFDAAVLVRSMDFAPLEEVMADSLMQEWLFFTLLADVFRVVGISIELDAFVKPAEARYIGEPQREVVETCALTKYLEKWRHVEGPDYERLIAAAESRKRCLKIFELLKRAQTATENLLKPGNRYAQFGPLGFSIISLLETLQHAAHLIYASVLSSQERLQLTLYIPKAPWLAARMQRLGWCPNEISRLQFLFSNSGLYFASSLELPAESRFFDHSQCHEQQCGINNIDRNSYRSKHRCSSGNCEHTGPTMREIGDVLSGGKIPVLELQPRTEDSSAPVKFTVTSSDSVPYTAISHVWSDGRGNLVANTLPLCQVLHLASLVQKLSPERTAQYFWIDTLCCPVQMPLRRTAIGLMRRTYEEAAEVLVLDSSLEFISTNTSCDDLLIRIACTGWMRRLWTLQEGVLARKLFFQFRDGAIDLGVLRDTVDGGPEHRLRSLLSADALACSDSFRKFKDLGSSGILELVRALQWRATSWSQDETICLSILLDLDVDRVIRSREEDRMGTFWSMLEEFPFQLALISGPRLQQNNLTWAPRSLMPPVGTNLPNSNDVIRAKSFPSGLFVQHEAIWLDECPDSDAFWLRLKGDSDKYLIRNLSEREDGGPSWRTNALDLGSDLALIPSGTTWAGTDIDLAMMVNVTFLDERTPGQLVGKCKYISRAFIMRDVNGIEWERFESMARQDGSRATSAMRVFTAERTERGTWCIQ
jgi:hypothetical protein